jgi:hypothetical protein
LIRFTRFAHVLSKQLGRKVDFDMKILFKTNYHHYDVICREDAEENGHLPLAQSFLRDPDCVTERDSGMRQRTSAIDGKFDITPIIPHRGSTANAPRGLHPAVSRCGGRGSAHLLFFRL